MDLYPENKKYFGLSEFIESTLSGHSLPLLRYDSSFEAMVTALGKRYTSLLEVATNAQESRASGSMCSQRIPGREPPSSFPG